jgi:hypothetical protein
MSLQNALITTGAPAALYTSVGNTVISTVHICNDTANPVTANVYMVPSGFSANALCLIYGNVSISAYNTLITQEKFALGNGDAVYANVSVASGVNSVISWIGI